MAISENWLDEAEPVSAMVPTTGWLAQLKPYLIEQKRTGRHEPNDVFRNQVMYFSGMGLTQEQMAVLLQISTSTLTKYYAHELKIGASIKNIQVAESIFQIALDQSNKSAATAAMWWLERRGGENWKPAAKRIEHTGADGGAIAIENRPLIDSSKLTFEQRQALREIILAVGSPAELESPEEATDGYADAPDESA